MNTIQVVHIIFCFFLFWLPLCQKIIPRCEKQWDVCLSTLYIKLQPKSTRNRGLLNSDKIYICYQGGVKVLYWYKSIDWRSVHQFDRNLSNCQRPYQFCYFAMDFVIQFLNMSTPTGNNDFPTSTINCGISINSYGPDNSSYGYERSSDPLTVLVLSMCNYNVLL